MKSDKDQTMNIQSENSQAEQSDELSEEELHTASGGGLYEACCNGKHIPKIVIY
jgi:type VI protein secretion system component Hcp